MKLQVLTWTPSRFAKWKECPAKVKYEDLMKMCPKCFRGRVSGGYDGEPVVCDTCDAPQPEREALDRGNRLDAALTVHLAGREALAKPGPAPKVDSGDFLEAVRHPKIEKLVKNLRKAKGVSAQESIVLDSKWSRVGQFTKHAWARLKLDVLRLAGKRAEVIDWKSGNIDKSKGVIRERDEYHDSMRAYQIAVLSVYPAVQEAKATMAFLDAPPKLEDPFKEPHTGVLRRSELVVAQRQWEQKIAPMMADAIFAPRPGYYCTWCPFSKSKGGPCPH